MSDETIINMRERVNQRRQQEAEELSIFPPLEPEQTRVKGRLIIEPPDPEPILTYQDQPILTRGVVGALVAAGGVGKSFFVLQLGYAMSRGSALGPLQVEQQLKVLVLAGEDPQDELDRRLWRIGGGMFPEGLHAYSVLGQVGPLMELDESGNPQRAEGWHWLNRTIQLHKDLDVLMLDPKSRFYGLTENDNDHATQWVACLENLSQQHKLTILFTHHVSKARAESLNQAMSRGASALVDGCRWIAGIASLTPQSAKRYFGVNHRNVIELDIVKSNYAAQLPGTLFFKRGEGGVLEYANFESERREAISKALYHALNEDTERYSRRELLKNKGKPIIDAVKDEIADIKKIVEIEAAIDDLLDRELLTEYAVKTTGAPKTILQPMPEDINNPRHRFSV